MVYILFLFMISTDLNAEMCLRIASWNALQSGLKHVNFDTSLKR